MYRLLALDMDGTLLNKRKIVTDTVKQAIRSLLVNGTYVTLASGRFPASVWLHGKYLGLNAPLVALNGAVLLNQVDGAVLHASPLPQEIAVRIAEFAEQEQTYVHFYGYNTLFVEELNEMNAAWPLANVVVSPDLELTESNYRGQVHMIQVNPVGRLPIFLRNYTGPIYKATIIDQNPDKVDIMCASLSQWPEIAVFRTGRKRFDINLQHVSKRSCLEKLCADLRIERKEVAAIGDFDNDIDMLSWAGLGICMGNGNESTKRAADDTTASNEENGVAVAIRKHFAI
ncbi:MAG TPA: Cof-type HAD-IIB family hydrolase [Bacilli bacterium]